MLDQVLVGAVTSVCNVTIHALVMLIVIRVANAVAQQKRAVAFAAPCHHDDSHSFSVDSCTYAGSTRMGDRLFFC